MDHSRYLLADTMTIQDAACLLAFLEGLPQVQAVYIKVSPDRLVLVVLSPEKMSCEYP